jgi:hypothetical protein
VGEFDSKEKSPKRKGSMWVDGERKEVRPIILLAWKKMAK